MSDPQTTTDATAGPPTKDVGDTDVASKRRIKIHFKNCSNVPQSRLFPGQDARVYFVLAQTVVGDRTIKFKSQRAQVDVMTNTVTWDQNVYMDCLDSAIITFKIIELHTLKDKIVCEKVVPVSELLSPDGPSQVSFPTTGKKVSAPCVLHFCASQVMDEGQGELGFILGSVPSAVSTSADSAISVVGSLTLAGSSSSSSSSTTTKAWLAVLEKIEFVADVVEAFSDIFPYTRVAWSVISAGYKLAKNQQDRDAKVEGLLETMRSTLDIITGSNALTSMQPYQKKALAALMNQTTECGYFVIDYQRKGFWHNAFRGVASSADKAIDEYCDRLAKLQTAFFEQSTHSTQVLVQLVLEKIDDIGSTIQLSEMPYSKDARWRSDKMCLPGTRTALISRIIDWVNLSDDGTPRVLLLTGLAGTGKSSVAHTVASYLETLCRLGSSYCFDRNNAADRRPAMLLSTLARDLADYLPSFKQALARSASTSAIRTTTDLGNQFESFISTPLADVSVVGPLVIVIDALDESGGFAEREGLLKLLAERLPQLPSYMRFVLTSRPESDVLDAFARSESLIQLSMDDADEQSLHSDMIAYVASLLVDRQEMPLNHFGRAHYEAIVLKAEGLFQWANVACNMITGKKTSRIRPSAKKMTVEYEKLMSLNTGTHILDALYMQVLSDLFRDTDNGHEIFRSLLGRVLAAFEPLSAESLFSLLQVSEDDREDCEAVLNGLGALMTGTTNLKEPVRLLHSSFRDFLLTENRSGGQFHVVPSSHHAVFAFGCLDILKQKLCFNICGLESSYTLNKDVVDLQAKIQACVPDTLRYAARFWGDYLEVQSVPERNDIASRILTLLCTKFLFWLELLSVLGAVKTAVSALNNAAQLGELEGLQDMIADCSRFVNVFAYPIASSAPHVYLSAYALCPTEVLIKRQYSQHKWLVAQLSGPASITWAQAINLIHPLSLVHSVAFSPDGHHIVSGLENGSVCIWNSRTSELVGLPLQRHKGQVYSVSCSLDNRHIVSCSQDSTICIWDKATGNLMHQLSEHSDKINSVALSPDGIGVVSGSDDETICIWDIESGKLVGSLKGHNKSVMSVGFSPDGCYIVSGSLDNTVRVWDANTGSTDTLLVGHAEGVTSVLYSPDGHHIFSGSLDGNICVWDAKTGRCEHSLFLPPGNEVYSLACSLKGYLAIGSTTSIFLWDMKSSSLLDSVLDGHTSDISSVDFSSDGDYLVSGSWDARIRVWDVRADNTTPLLTPGHTSYVTSVAFSPDGQLIASCSWDRTICISDARTGECIRSPFKGHTNRISSVTWSPNGLYIASGSYDKTVRIWDVQTGTSMGLPLERHSGAINSIAYSPNGQWIASGADDHMICIWNAHTSTLVESLILTHDSEVRSVVFSRDGRYIASGTQKGYVNIWDAQSGDLIREHILEPRQAVCSVNFSPDGHLLLSGSEDHTIRVWETETGTLSGYRVWDIETATLLGYPLEKPTWNVTSAAFSSDGQYIISCSHRSICIWDVKRHSSTRYVSGHISGIESIAVSPDGLIASGSRDKSVRIWSLHNFLQTTHFTFSPEPSQALRDYPRMAKSIQSELTTNTPQFDLFYGWILDISVKPPRLLIWIPPEAREGMYIPYTTRIIGQVVHSLDLSNFVHGHRWTECWTGAADQEPHGME